jgi:acetylornithine deacetylase/succinyl-diaminopimelate desuccinylase-like protein
MNSQGELPDFEGSMLPALEAWPSEATQQVIEGVSLPRIKDRILTLAAVNGESIDATVGHPAPHYATNRLALSLQDILARRELIEPWMEQAGMETKQHPLGVIGRFIGRNNEEAPLVVLSHVDTVPSGDMYDGTLGVIAGIEAVSAIRQVGIETERDILVLALTGEESAAFGFPLFGSRGMFHGLTATELKATNSSRERLSTILGAENVTKAKQPIFGADRQYPLPIAGIELHVEQASGLESRGTEIGLIEAIAAPERYRAIIGKAELEPDATDYAHQSIFELRVAGKANHSGTTPITPSARADGLLATTKFLHDLISEGSFNEGLLTVGDINVEGGSINKIPGVTTTQLRIAAGDRLSFQAGYEALRAAIEERNASYEYQQTDFADAPFSLTDVKPEAAPRFFRSDAIGSRQLAAFDMIKTVNNAAVGLKDHGVVGTVGTYTTLEGGLLELAIDIRGTNLKYRSEVVDILQNVAANYPEPIELGKPLAGSGEPVVMDSRLLAIATQALNGSQISSEIMPCLAGHDIQNVVRAGVPGLLLLCQSNNGGLAHHPEAYTSDEHLLKGAQALASLMTLLSTIDITALK